MQKSLPINSQIIAGVDEAGRGALAGPVVSCCVVFKDSFTMLDILNDSKALSEKKRHDIFWKIIKHIYLGIGIVSNKRIDKINILNATLVSMSIAINKCKTSFDHIIIDGKQTPKNIKKSCVAMVKADQKINEVKAASICAKILRDRLMDKYHRIYPQYNFNQHKGYGTETHYDRIFEHAICKIHRKSFNLSKQLTLF